MHGGYPRADFRQLVEAIHESRWENRTHRQDSGAPVAEQDCRGLRTRLPGSNCGVRVARIAGGLGAIGLDDE